MKTLSPAEIGQLERQGCRARDWNTVRIDEQTDLGAIWDVRFAGSIDIGSGVRLENSRLEQTGTSSYGVGTRVSVLNEAGGKDILLTETLSAQEAWIEVMCSGRERLVAVMHGAAARQAEALKGQPMTVGRGASIIDCGLVRDVIVGEGAVLEGAALVEDATIRSTAEHPAKVGRGVQASHVIMQRGARIESAALVERVYVGEASILGHGYSASDSVFFANCQGENGEACAVFAGPYTVTHHKSTLLIAGMFSFMNAGSGSNQSNHMYKSGPVHWGVLERGSKTASGSHILWPARIGSFSMVMGKLDCHPDLTALPFSYIISKEGVTRVSPGANLGTLGTKRDVEKWPKRDKRPDDGRRLDLIHFDWLNPVTAAEMRRGLELLETFHKVNPKSDTIYEGCVLSAHAVKRGMHLYRLGLSLYEALWQTAGSPEEWIDMAGLLAPKAEVERILSDIETSGEAGRLRPALEKLYARHTARPLSQLQGSESFDELERLIEIDREKETVMLAFHDNK